ncbi:hypothetical protein DM01DRAFT_1326639 [Hesseltinella vesiculosa]|uniref:PROP1-like PPR domain-containing protein n=1 Tax=Hesseltinella vesiculosa TaxID=101127 RepID=A0A1X2G8S6_9FUNG|nr:hypothetical protein DM01DRAFT_1326639 [Hesseltinella vesiculosa]
MYKGSAVLNSVTRQSALTKQLATLHAANKTTAFISSIPARSGKLYTTSKALNTNADDKDQHLNNNPFAPLARSSSFKPTATTALAKHSTSIRFHSSVARQLAPETEAVVVEEPSARILDLARRNRHEDVVRVFADSKSSPLNEKAYEAVVSSYGSTHNKHEPLTAMLSVYEQMVANGIRPTSKTYAILIKNLCARDAEVNRTTNVIRRKMDVQSTSSEVAPAVNRSTSILSRQGDTLQALEAENNMERAVAVFEQAVKDNSTQDFDVALYNNLLRGLSYTGNIQDGIFIYEHLESGRLHPNSTTFAMLMSMFGNAGDLKAVKECFSEYKLVSNKLPSHDPSYVYNALVFAHVNAGDLQGALQVVERTMAHDKVPITISPYNRILFRACADGDMELVDSLVTKLEAGGAMPKPDANTYGLLLATYSRLNRLEDAHRAFTSLTKLSLNRQYGHLTEYVTCCLHHHQYTRAMEALSAMTQFGLELDVNLCCSVVQSVKASDKPAHAAAIARQVLQWHAKTRFIDAKSPLAILAMDIAEQVPTLRASLDLLNALKNFSVAPSTRALENTLQLYQNIHNTRDMTLLNHSVAYNVPRSFGLLFDASLRVYGHQIDAYQDLVFNLIDDMHTSGARLDSKIYAQVASHLQDHGALDAEAAWKKKTADLLPRPTSTDQSQATAPDSKSDAEYHTELTLRTNVGDLPTALEILRTNASDPNRVPLPNVIRDMIQKANKMNDITTAMSIHDVVSPMFERLDNPDLRKRSLTTLYNDMLIAHARVMDLESAKVFYDKLRQMDQLPDADAYGALLTCTVNDTTDESLDAMVIYEEAKKHNVRPTVYFYNVILSKLSKCRKKDKVLEMFSEMKSLGVTPNSITYANLISACLRCSAENKAVRFFDEMVASSNYQPRIGVFNAFIQFYVEQKQDRASALKFFQLLKQANLSPTSHTYKLLIQAYASIAPFDMVTAHSMLTDMNKRHHVKPTATHYATLVRSYGCMHRDVASAEAVYHEMQKAGIPPNDLVYQAMLDSYIDHHMMDKAESLYQDMHKHNVKSSPYIENLFIRGYGAMGQLDKAAQVFDKMQDELVSKEAIVREPSTYETMVKAYVDSGDVSKANVVLTMMQKRDFPAKVVEGVASLLPPA